MLINMRKRGATQVLAFSALAVAGYLWLALGFAWVYTLIAAAISSVFVMIDLANWRRLRQRGRAYRPTDFDGSIARFLLVAVAGPLGAFFVGGVVGYLLVGAAEDSLNPGVSLRASFLALCTAGATSFAAIALLSMLDGAHNQGEQAGLESAGR